MKETFWLSGNFLFLYFSMLFVPLGILFIMKALEDERHIVMKTSKFTILSDFLYYHTLS